MIQISGRHKNKSDGGDFIGPIKPLGDRIDYINYCNTISKLENCEVYMSPNSIFKDKEEILKLFNNPKLSFSEMNCKRKITCTPEHMNQIYSKIDDWFKISNLKDPRETLPNLPEKYITMQWDALQKYRIIDNSRKEKIIRTYKQMGYETIIIGGKSPIPELANGSIELLCSVISKAKLHVGVDSACAHLAKIILPTNNIHLYVNTDFVSILEHGHRFPLGLTISGMAYEIFKKGGRMNYLETYQNKDI
jgi:hypothetical protein